MARLNLGVEVRDFDLERMGFSLSVLDQTGKRQTSEGYLRMTLQEMGAFLDALRAARGEIEVTAVDLGMSKPPSLQVGSPRPRTTPE
jgi:hypothetical protein